MRPIKQKSVMSVRSYSGKTFFGLTVITAVVWVNGQIFFFPPREFVGAYLQWKFEVCKCRGCRGIAGERHTQTHTQTLTCDIDPVPISIYFKFWIWNIKTAHPPKNDIILIAVEITNLCFSSNSVQRYVLVQIQFKIT